MSSDSYSPRRHTLAYLLAFAAVLWVIIGGSLRAAPVTYAQARDHLVQFEGYRTRPYKDGEGWSVGIGHSLTANGERGQWKRPYTDAEVTRWFRADLAWAWDACRAGIERFDDLPQAVQLIALGVAFQTGRTGFHRFHAFRTALSYRAYESAAMELQHSRWFHQSGAARVNAYLRTLRSL